MRSSRGSPTRCSRCEAASPSRLRRRRSSASAPAAASATCCRICAAARRRTLAQVLRGLVVAANQDPQLVAGVLDLFGDKPVDLSRDRPRQGAHPRDRHQLDLPGAADLARRLLRQRHQSVWPHLAGAGAGRGRGPRVGRRHLPHQCAQRGRRDGAAAQPCRSAHRARPAGAGPLQQYARRDHSGRSGAGRLVRPGARRDGRGRGEDAADRLSRSVDRHLVPGEARRRADPDHPRASRCCSPISSLSALYESWTIPVPVLLSVSVGVARRFLRHRPGRA